MTATQKFGVGFVCCAALVGVNASAQTSEAPGVSSSAGSQMRMAGTAPGVCRIASPTTLSSRNAVFSSNDSNGGQVTVQQLVNPVTGVAQASEISLSFAAVCNVAHSVNVRSNLGGLTREEGVVDGSFASRVDYRLDARWAGVSATRTFSGTPGQIAIPVEDGAIGALELDFQTSAGGVPLASGRYSDAVIIVLTAAS